MSRKIDTLKLCTDKLGFLHGIQIRKIYMPKIRDDKALIAFLKASKVENIVFSNYAPREPIFDALIQTGCKEVIGLQIRRDHYPQAISYIKFASHFSLRCPIVTEPILTAFKESKLQSLNITPLRHSQALFDVIRNLKLSYLEIYITDQTGLDCLIDSLWSMDLSSLVIHAYENYDWSNMVTLLRHKKFKQLSVPGNNHALLHAPMSVMQLYIEKLQVTLPEIRMASLEIYGGTVDRVSLDNIHVQELSITANVVCHDSLRALMRRTHRCTIDLDLEFDVTIPSRLRFLRISGNRDADLANSDLLSFNGRYNFNRVRYMCQKRNNLRVFGYDRPIHVEGPYVRLAPKGSQQLPRCLVEIIAYYVGAK